MRQYSGCDGKLRFGSFTRAARVASRKRRNQDQRFSAYACEQCGGFHVGSDIGYADRSKAGLIKLQRYTVWAVNGDGPPVVVGWSNEPDGGRVAKVIGEEPGWRVTAVIERKRRAA